jgi:transposase-like protein
LVTALLAEEEAEGLDVGRETIDDIEDAMIRIGDAVAREVGVQKLAPHTGEASGPCPCPQCGQAGVYLKRHARELISSRGNVPLSETKYYCPKCRRNFFPSDEPSGD